MVEHKESDVCDRHGTCCWREWTGLGDCRGPSNPLAVGKRRWMGERRKSEVWMKGGGGREGSFNGGWIRCVYTYTHVHKIVLDKHFQQSQSCSIIGSYNQDTPSIYPIVLQSVFNIIYSRSCLNQSNSSSLVINVERVYRIYSNSSRSYYEFQPCLSAATIRGRLLFEGGSY